MQERVHRRRSQALAATPTKPDTTVTAVAFSSPLSTVGSVGVRRTRSNDPGGFELQQRELASLYRHAHATSLQDGRQRMPHSQACRSGCLTPLIGEHSRTVISFRSTSAATAHNGRCTYVETDRLARPGEGGARQIGLPVERDATSGENFEEDDRHRAFTPRPR